MIRTPQCCHIALCRSCSVKEQLVGTGCCVCCTAKEHDTFSATFNTANVGQDAGKSALLSCSCQFWT